ncbi:MAG TPA: phosphatase PAP2 family protein [Candidatus Binataceae bacterium]|nr:phosphatase PAP2 family protein [Candidatus Binataceae bacterium]
MARTITALVAIAIVVGATAASARAQYYLNPAQVDLVKILAPPPIANSPQGKADLQAVLDAQRDRTPAAVASARADAYLSVFRFADVMGPGFTPENLPFTKQFFARLVVDDERAIDPAKDHFGRLRPYAADPEVKPILHPLKSDSYPSGHATFAYATAILLAQMVPEKAEAIFARADRFAENRVIAGVHYPTDIEAGWISASVIDNVLFHEPRFETDQARATAEVRHALGLSPTPPLD